MKYEIRIEGGFTGIPKEYQGELVLNADEKKHLLDTLKMPVKGNSKIKDGMNYSIRLIDKDKPSENNYDETNLPLEIRKFIDRISQKNSI